MSGFKLNTQSENIFLINFSEINERLDIEFYKENFDFSEFIKLKQIAKVKGGKRIPKGYYYANDETSFIYLRVSDLNSDGEINWKKVKYIDNEVFKILERYEILEEDLVFSIAGSVGKINVVKNIPEGKRVILTENASKIHFKKDIGSLPEFIELVLKTSFLQKQINLNYVQTTIPKIGLDRIEKLFIPKLVTIDEQIKILNKYKDFYKSKQQKENKAKELLASIDEYLLYELGVELPEKDNSLQNRIFTTTLSEISGSRFDPFYLTNCLVLPISTKFEETEIHNIAKVEKGQSITSTDIIDGEYPVIAGGQSSPYSHNKFNQNKNIITISASGAYSGFAWYHTVKIFASDCSVVKSKNEKKISTEFIFNVLKLKQQQLYNLQQGSGQPHVYPSDIKRIKIPLPPKEKQTEITNHITDLRNQVKQLELDADQIMIEAKAEVEKLIMR